MTKQIQFCYFILDEYKGVIVAMPRLKQLGTKKPAMIEKITMGVHKLVKLVIDMITDDHCISMITVIVNLITEI